MKKLHVYGKLYSFGEKIGLTEGHFEREAYEDSLLTADGRFAIDRRYPFSKEVSLSRTEGIIGHCIINIKDDGLYVDAEILDKDAELLYKVSREDGFDMKLGFMVKYKNKLKDGTITEPKILEVYLSKSGLAGTPEFKWIEE